MKLWNRMRPFVILCVIFFLPVSASAQQSEYMMKAVFLEHFTRFIEWPETYEVADPSYPFYVAVIGESPFGSILEQIYIDQEIKIKNRKVEILYISSPAEIPDCHILFISSSSKEILPEILSYTGNKPILTVGDSKGFAEAGVLINFYLAGSKMKFEIKSR